MRIQRPNQRGFTLMELIAVMAIMAILSAVLAPSLIDAIDDAYAAAETENIATLADDLERHIRITGTLPGRSLAEWSAAIAGTSSTPLADVQRNQRGYTRSVYFDPNFFVSGGSFNGYVQTTGLAAAPFSPRFMLISSLRGNVGVLPNDAVQFDDIWNRASGATLVESDSLKIERRNLRGLFHRLLLANQNPAQVAFSLNGSGQLAVPAATAGGDGLVSRYVLEGSEVAVYGTPFPTGGLLSATLVQGDISLRYADDGGVFEWVTP